MLKLQDRWIYINPSPIPNFTPPKKTNKNSILNVCCFKGHTFTYWDTKNHISLIMLVTVTQVLEKE